MMTFGSTRDLREGVVSFDRWEHENEHQKIDAEYFQEGIENNLRDDPPSMAVDTDESGGDVVVEFSLSALGDSDDIGPAWRFSLKDALTGLDCSKEDAIDLLNALQAVVKHLQAEIGHIPEPGRINPRYALCRKPRLIGLDGKDVPKSYTRRIIDEVLAPKIAQEMMETLLATDLPSAEALNADIAAWNSLGAKTKS